MIGLFDSGSGGLSVLAALRKLAPQADIAYFGDIKNAPYGSKSPQELEKLAFAGIATLKTMRASELIAACNSVSPSVLANAAEESPMIEMSLPMARFLRTRAGERILLIATPATIASGLYKRALTPMVSLDPLAIPELAGAIEFGASDGDIADIVRNALTQKRGEHYDAIILACTHYPLIRDILERETRSILGPTELIDPAEAVAREALARFHTEGTGKLLFRISKESEPFRRRVAALFPDAQKTIEIQ